MKEMEGGSSCQTQHCLIVYQLPPVCFIHVLYGSEILFLYIMNASLISMQRTYSTNFQPQHFDKASGRSWAFASISQCFCFSGAGKHASFPLFSGTVHLPCLLSFLSYTTRVAETFPLPPWHKIKISFFPPLLDLG